MTFSKPGTGRLEALRYPAHMAVSEPGPARSVARLERERLLIESYGPIEILHRVTVGQVTRPQIQVVSLGADGLLRRRYRGTRAA